MHERTIKSVCSHYSTQCVTDITAMQTMRFTEPRMSEHIVAAHFEYLCAREGSQRPAYVPVVASG